MQVQNLVSQTVDGSATNPGVQVVATNPSAPPAPVNHKKTADIQPSPAQLQGAVDNINKSFKQSNTSLEFSVDSTSHRAVVKMVDSATGELIKQYPSKTAIAISNAIDLQLKSGVLLNQKA